MKNNQKITLNSSFALSTICCCICLQHNKQHVIISHLRENYYLVFYTLATFGPNSVTELDAPSAIGTKIRLNSSINPSFKKEPFKRPPPSSINLSIENRFLSFFTTTVKNMDNASIHFSLPHSTLLDMHTWQKHLCISLYRLLQHHVMLPLSLR